MSRSSYFYKPPRGVRVPEPGGSVAVEESSPPINPNPTLSVCFEALPWRAQVAALRGLADGYAGPGTVAPTERSIRSAESLLHITTFPIQAVLPDGKGGILIHYANGRRTAIFEDPLHSGNWWIEFSPMEGDLHGKRSVYRLGEQGGKR